MAKIAQGTIHKFTTGEFVDADTAPQGGALNPIFEIIRLALNDTDGRVDNVYTKTESDNKVIAAASGMQSAFTSTAPTPVTLNYGQQVLTMAETAPLQNLKLQGRTLVNVAGRLGGMEAIGKNDLNSVTETADTTNFVNGTQSLKYTASGASVEHYAAVGRGGTTSLSVKPNTNYIMIGHVKPNVGQAKLRAILYGAGAAPIYTDSSSAIITDTTKFALAYVKVPANANAALLEPRVQVLNTSGVTIFTPAGTAENASFDSVRIYEITAADYAAIDLLTADQINAKYPYVDDIKSIANPYAIKQGENLFPPFSDWSSTATGTSKVEILAPYSAKITSLDASNFGSMNINIPVVAGQTYTLSGDVQFISGTTEGLFFYWMDASGVRLATESTVTRKPRGTYTVPSGVAFLQVYFTLDARPDTQQVSNPMLNIGSTALAFKPKNDDYLFFPNVQLSSSVDGTIYDILSQRDGKYFKLSRYKTMDVDGSLAWSFHADYTGFKSVSFPLTGILQTTVNALLVKYDGKILKTGTVGSSADVLDANTTVGALYVEIADTDSGWGETYTPTVAEIQAYFYGYKMYDSNVTTLANAQTSGSYNGTGTKAWVNKVGTPAGNGSAPTSQSTGTGWTNYKLQYQLAASLTEEVQVEGAITLHEGLNQIEVGNGIIVRERTTPVLSNGFYEFNNSNSGLITGKFKNKVSKLITVYENEHAFYKLNKVAAGAVDTLNGERFNIPSSNYDQYSAYTVTYVAEQFGITSNLVQLTAEYPTNIKTTIDQLAINQADMTTRIGVLENTKAGKAQPQWIVPTLLGGWVNRNTGADALTGYLKDSSGFVHIRGIVTSGSASVTLFYLPVGYRPLKTVFLPVYTYNGAAVVIAYITVGVDGSVFINAGAGNTYMFLDVVPFLAEA